MNIKRLLNIAQEADKIGDYVTADKVDNLLKTAQGQYPVHPNQAAQVNPNTNNSTKVLSDQQYNNINTQYISNIISNAHAWNSAMVKVKSYGTPGTAGYNQQEIDKLYASMNTISEKLRNLFEAIRQDKRLNQQQKEQMIFEGQTSMDSINAKYESGQLQQTPGLQISGGPGTAAIPVKDEQGQYINLSSVPQQTQQMPQQGGVYNPGMAPGATYYTPGVVNVAQPQMTEEQKAFADFRGLRAQVQQADQVVRYQSMQPRQYPIYQTYQQPVYQGTNTQAQYNFNPNAPTNMNLYGTGYASKAMQPQPTQPPYNPQQQTQPQQQYPNNQRRRPNN